MTNRAPHGNRSLPRTSLRAAIFGFLVLATGSALGRGSCPLTESQSQKAAAAFDKIANVVLNEPRCVNCHGGVNPHITGIGLDPHDPTAPASLIPHGGGAIRKSTDGTIEAECMDCHNNMANKRDGSPTKQWMTAANFHSFVDKDSTSLCRQFKKSLGSAEEFLGHVTDDNGGNNFAQTAFNGNRGLNADQYLDPGGPTYVAPKPPSISHQALLQLAQEWVNAMGGKFQGDESCGCEPAHDNWSGMIRYVLDNKGDEGHEQWSDWSNSSISMITISVKNGVGTIRYSVQASEATQNRSVGYKGGVQTVFNSSSTAKTSAEKTYPATISVLFMADGTYMVSLGQALIYSIGKKRVANCRDGSGCQTADLDVYPPRLPVPKGKVQDPNRLQNSDTVKKEGLGRSRKAISIETMTVDLWRTGSN
ncbi:MAG TPA: hypothetical protein VE820_06635 [Sphingomicrobium sp.]|jgi:hypothetical protein|nr:hypothetical protein [Sphingomicrobium sp.]